MGLGPTPQAPLGFDAWFDAQHEPSREAGGARSTASVDGRSKVGAGPSVVPHRAMDDGERDEIRDTLPGVTLWPEEEQRPTGVGSDDPGEAATIAGEIPTPPLRPLRPFTTASRPTHGRALRRPGGLHPRERTLEDEVIVDEAIGAHQRYLFALGAGVLGLLAGITTALLSAS